MSDYADFDTALIYDNMDIAIDYISTYHENKKFSAYKHIAQSGANRIKKVISSRENNMHKLIDILKSYE